MRRRARLESLITYDAERAAQTIATPRIALADFELLACRVFRKNGSGFAVGIRARSIF
jgi:hypothetical protein